MTRTVVLEAPGSLRVEPRDVPVPGDDDVVVRVEWAGICGSDVDLFTGQRPTGFVRYPVVPGHEWAGDAVAVGAGVDPALVGHGVVAEGIRPCERCGPCRAGNAPQCGTGYDETGFTRDGAWADHLVVPAALVHRLPPGADLRAAAGIEPAACAAAAAERADVIAGQRVVVVGGGTIGLLTAQLLRAAEPSELRAHVCAAMRREQALAARRYPRDMTNVEFYVDPSCPWAWITSRWVVEVASQRDLTVLWRSYCLEIRDDYGVAPTVPEEFRERALIGHAVSHLMLRVFEAARSSCGEAAVDALYTEWGRRFFARGQTNDDGLLEECVSGCGLDPGLVDAAGDEKWDAPIIEAMEIAYAFGGPKTQTPTIVVRSDPPHGFKGPVMAPAPTGEAALRLWDAILVLSQEPGFFEITRPRANPPRVTLPA